MKPLDFPSRQAAVSWGHYTLAVTNKRERNRLRHLGVRTTILVDADIMIGQSSRSEEAGLFEDLLDAEVSKRYSAPLCAFFYDWVFENLRRRGRDDGPVWGVAPEHFREIVNKANFWLDEVDEPGHFEPSLGDSDNLRVRLDAVLGALEANPWSNVDGDVAELLGILGVNFGEPSRWEVIDNLKQWLDCLSKTGHVPGGKSSSTNAAGALDWPRFETDHELKVLRAWRSRLWEVRHDRADSSSSSRRSQQDRRPRTKNIDADARVLAALTLLNRDWEKTGRRVELLTASKYLLRAVSGSALVPSFTHDEPDDPSSGSMANFIHMPSMILPEESLWEQVEAERDANAETIAEWGMPRVETVGEESIDWYALINGPQSDGHGRTLRLAWQGAANTADVHPNVLRLGSSFRQFFSEKVSKSVALAHVRDRLGAQRGARAAWTRAQLQEHSMEEVSRRSAELSELRRIQLRVDMLEYLIQAHHLKQEWVADTGNRNPLRGPPYVDFGAPDYTLQLRDALIAIPPAPRAKVLQIKLQVFEHDPSTYKLALAYASVYANQSLWRLAASAAEYAFLLSQTAEYHDSRPERVLGDEAKLLHLACLRRAATTPAHLEKAERLLADYRREIPQVRKIEPLIEIRLELEHSSLTLTRLLMEFFAAATDRPQSEYRSRVGEALHELVELKTANVDLLAPNDGDLRGATLADIEDRVSANICNLACLAVGWSPSELKRGSMLAPRRDALARHHSELVVGLVNRLLGGLAKSANERVATWSARPTHKLLTTFTACMVMAPELLGLSDRARLDKLVDALQAWRDHPYDHPYDLMRIDYALELTNTLRF